jgi:solute carrier family 35, member E1
VARTRAAAAAASPAAAGKQEGAAGISQTLQLGTMILVWYLLNIYFNIYNKLVCRFLLFPKSFRNGVAQPNGVF